MQITSTFLDSQKIRSTSSQERSQCASFFRPPEQIKHDLVEFNISLILRNIMAASDGPGTDLQIFGNVCIPM